MDLDRALPLSHRPITELISGIIAPAIDCAIGFDRACVACRDIAPRIDLIHSRQKPCPADTEHLDRRISLGRRIVT